MKDKEENAAKKESLPQPDFKEVFFTSDGVPVILKHDFVLAKRANAIRNFKFHKKEFYEFGAANNHNFYGRADRVEKTKPSRLRVTKRRKNCCPSGHELLT